MSAASERIVFACKNIRTRTHTFAAGGGDDEEPAPLETRGIPGARECEKLWNEIRITLLGIYTRRSTDRKRARAVLLASRRRRWGTTDFKNSAPGFPLVYYKCTLRPGRVVMCTAHIYLWAMDTRGDRGRCR